MREDISTKHEIAPSVERSTYREKAQMDLSSQDRNLDTSILFLMNDLIFNFDLFFNR